MSWWPHHPVAGVRVCGCVHVMNKGGARDLSQPNGSQLWNFSHTDWEVALRWLPSSLQRGHGQLRRKPTQKETVEGRRENPMP